MGSRLFSFGTIFRDGVIRVRESADVCLFCGRASRLDSYRRHYENSDAGMNWKLLAAIYLRTRIFRESAISFKIQLRSMIVCFVV